MCNRAYAMWRIVINNKRGENVNNLLGILARLNNLQPLTATMVQAIKMLQFLCERRNNGEIKIK